MGTFGRLYAAWYAGRFVIVVTALVVIGAAPRVASAVASRMGRTITLEAPQPEIGHNFIAKLAGSSLSSDQAPLESVLYEIRTVRGDAVFASFDRRWSWSLVYRNLKSRFLVRFPGYGVDRRAVIGPGNQAHQDIRDHGAGRYSVWKGHLYFSASDNTSPLTNGRRYELFVPWSVGRLVPRSGGWLRTLAIVVLVLTILRAAGEQGRARRILANTLPGILVSALLLTAAFGLFEGYERWVRGGFTETVWPTRFDPVAGYLFEPGKEVWWTNHVDYWTKERVNSLGFLDHEPALPKPAGRFRLLIVGDSFIEAAQVPNSAKIQTLLAAKLAARLGDGRVDVVALGRSGTGQANQLGYYQRFGNQLAPDLVILLAVNNDLANNSPLLEAVRNGWHPHEMPRPFFETEGDGFRWLKPSEHWNRRKLAGTSQREYFTALRMDAAFAARLEGWEGPDAVDLDAMFWRRDIPNVYHEAIALTRRAIAEWRALGERDGFKVVIVGIEGLTRPGAIAPELPTMHVDRFRQVAQDVGVPFFDLAPYFFNQPNPQLAYWSQDSHWSRVGHEWAASAVFDYLLGSGWLPAAK